jgi:hypothetical protein
LWTFGDAGNLYPWRETFLSTLEWMQCMCTREELEYAMPGQSVHGNPWPLIARTWLPIAIRGRSVYTWPPIAVRGRPSLPVATRRRPWPPVAARGGPSPLVASLCFCGFLDF